MTDIKPIRTFRHGVSYWSKLESRWAEFWRTLGIAVEYEPQGYDVGDARPYLPDFWIPAWDAYVEIKPNGVDLEVARARVRGLARARGKLVMLIAGAPNEHLYTVDLYGERKGAAYQISGGRFAECPRCTGFGIVSDWGWTEIGQHACKDETAVPLHDPVNAPRLFAAYAAAFSLDGDPRNTDQSA